MQDAACPLHQARHPDGEMLIFLYFLPRCQILKVGLEIISAANGRRSSFCFQWFSWEKQRTHELIMDEIEINRKTNFQPSKHSKFFSLHCCPEDFRKVSMEKRRLRVLWNCWSLFQKTPKKGKTHFIHQCKASLGNSSNMPLTQISRRWGCIMYDMWVMWLMMVILELCSSLHQLSLRCLI